MIPRQLEGTNRCRRSDSAEVTNGRSRNRYSVHETCATTSGTLGHVAIAVVLRSDTGLTGWPPQPARPVVLAGICAQSPPPHQSPPTSSTFFWICFLVNDNRPITIDLPFWLCLAPIVNGCCSYYQL